MFKNVRIIRYIGNKTNLYDFIVPELKKELKGKNNFYELFAGTCAISFEINKLKKNIYANDISLFSNIIFELLNININNINVLKLTDFMEYIDNNEPNELIKKYNIKELYITNELSMGGNVTTVDNLDMFNNQEFNSRMYFPMIIGKKIDIIKFFLKKNIHNFNKEEQTILLNMLLNFADKHANTTGVYGAFLKKCKINNIRPFYNKNLFFEIINYIKKYNNNKTVKKFYKEDILEFIKNTNIENSVIYFDPPYNTRDYQTNYHILNYIVDLNFKSSYIKKNSKTAVPKQELRIKNISSSKQAIYNNFNFILDKLKNKNNSIFISYSSTGILDIKDYKKLANELKYNFELKEQDYKAYKSKKEHKIDKVKEYLIKLK